MKAALVLALSTVIFVGLGCGGPLLQNVPHPNNAAMAGGFAGAAAAATAISPANAQKNIEAANKAGARDKKPVNVKETVPPDVLDRLDNPTPDDGKPKAEPLPPGQDPKLDTTDASEGDHAP
jgi:hypothetical protein